MDYCPKCRYEHWPMAYYQKWIMAYGLVEKDAVQKQVRRWQNVVKVHEGKDAGDDILQSFER